MFQKTKSSNHAEDNLYKELWQHASRQVIDLDHKASDALEIMLRMYLHPDAFALLKRFHCEFDQQCGCIGLTFQDALNELGGSAGIAGLQRTLRRAKKEEAA
ncbi:hypothetical protein [Hydrogenophaga sp. 2FB]|uniref:hypothetical protein n=1 Tax=Hydrogenophaga sp. 2FB TaxID=2502187 RepID=UPI0010F681BA|nr:hypothetical protein [Hydrogenophaga sp. 2FB]